MSTIPSSVRRTVKPEVIALGVLIPVVAITGLLLWRWPSSPTVSPTLTPVISPAAAVPVESTWPLGTGTPPASAKVPQKQNVQVSIVAGAAQADYQIPLTSSTSVANVMTQAERQGLRTKTRDFGGSLGLFFEEINGLANDPVQQLYWTLYVNGERSPLGASSAHVAPGDRVTWKYEVMKSEE